MVKASSSCTKYALIVFNLLFFVSERLDVMLTLVDVQKLERKRAKKHNNNKTIITMANMAIVERISRIFINFVE